MSDSRSIEEPVRFLAIVWTMPPTAGGSSVVTRNLLGEFNPDSLAIVGQIPYPGRMSMDEFEEYRRIEIPSYPIHWRIKPVVEPFFSVPATIRQGCRAVGEHNLQAVLGVYPNAAMLYAGYRISKKMNIPFFPYFHNLYAETRHSFPENRIARSLQRKVFNHADRVFVMNQGIADYYRDRYAVDAIPLVHPMSHAIPEYTEPALPQKPYTVTFSGNMNFTMLGLLSRVIRAIGDNPDYHIVIHAPNREEKIREDLDIWAGNITVKDVQRQEDLPGSLGACDLLLMGLENRSGPGMDDDFHTQFPTRTLDMLVAGKPILLFCQDDYFLARFFREQDCGHVVSATNPDEIRAAIEMMCTDHQRRCRYVRNALKTARIFEAGTVAQTLRQEMDRVVNG